MRAGLGIHGGVAPVHLAAETFFLSVLSQNNHPDDSNISTWENDAVFSQYFPNSYSQVIFRGHIGPDFGGSCLKMPNMEMAGLFIACRCRVFGATTPTQRRSRWIRRRCLKLRSKRQLTELNEVSALACPIPVVVPLTVLFLRYRTTTSVTAARIGLAVIVLMI